VSDRGGAEGVARLMLDLGRAEGRDDVTCGSLVALRTALKIRDVLTPGLELERSWGKVELDRGGAEGGDDVSCFSWGRAEGRDDVTCGFLVSLDTAHIHPIK
jgi:hypothetical protein